MYTATYRGFESLPLRQFFLRVFMVTCVGPLATIDCEPRQARKGATVTIDLGAGVWLAQVATLIDLVLVVCYKLLLPNSDF